jgi:transposase, IS30 family
MAGGRPKVSVERELRALGALARGASRLDAAALARISLSTLKRRLSEEVVAVPRDRRLRPGALSLEEREEIRVGIERKETDSEIARRLGRHRCSIGREIHLNGGRGAYRAYQSHDRADRAARRPRPPWTERRAWLWAEVQSRLRSKKWSPEQIAASLRREHPDEPEWWVGVPRGDLPGHLRPGQARAAQRAGHLPALGACSAPAPGPQALRQRCHCRHGQHLRLANGTL